MFEYMMVGSILVGIFALGAEFVSCCKILKDA